MISSNPIADIPQTQDRVKTRASAERPWSGEASRLEQDRRIAQERAKTLPGRSWLIVGAGVVAWALVAIPAYLIFG